MTEENLKSQLAVINWFISQTDDSMMGALVRAWLIQKREFIKKAGGIIL